MTNNVFLVNFVLNQQDDDLANQLWNNFDIQGFPQIFSNLNDAKKWILDVVKNDIVDAPDSLKISPDTWHDSDFDDDISIFGWGQGASDSWLVVRDCGNDTLVRFNIHRADVH